MADQQQRKIYVDEGEDFSKRQSYGKRVVTPVRFSTDPRDVAWVKENVPCQTACPAGTNIPAYIRMIVEERYGRSYEINRIANVLPGVLGRVCSRPCEPACRHGWPGNGEPVNICHLKRAAADLKTSGHRITEDLYTPSGKRVAIVGGGPAGLAAAHDLSILGHAVTIYEREQRPGGMLYYGIPEFRLPRHVLDVEVHNTTRLGVSVQTGIAVGNGEGEKRLSELRDQFDAVLLAAGCMRSTPVPLREQADQGDLVRALDGAEYGLDFLMELHRGVEKTVGERVAVIGAGFTALDCARVARRLGAKEVTIHIRTTEKYIPVPEEEIREAKREGVDIRGLRSPVALVADDQGRFEGVRFAQNRLGGWREGGRRKAIPIEGSEFLEPCDTVRHDVLRGRVRRRRPRARGIHGGRGRGPRTHDRAQARYLAHGPGAAPRGGESGAGGGADARAQRGFHSAPADSHRGAVTSLQGLRHRGRDGYGQEPRPRGGQTLLPLLSQVRDRRRQLHLLSRVHRRGAA
jgi:formate dehydrogenase major subunit